MMEVLGYVMVFIGGSLLHNVPFPRFITSMGLIIIGMGFILIK